MEIFALNHLLFIHLFLVAEPIGSMSSMEVNVDMLEQMDLVDMSDQEALDVFLNSGGEDSTMPSPMIGKKRLGLYLHWHKKQKWY